MMVGDHAAYFVAVHTAPKPYLAVVGCVVFIAVALIVVGSRYLSGGEAMEKPANRIAQLYGYSICLIAVIIFVFSLQNVSENLIGLSHPLQSLYGYGASLDSFEAYKATYTQDHPNGPYVTQDRGATRPEKLSDAQLRAQYEALRASRISSETFRMTKDLTVSGIMLLIAIVLFVLHWRWLRTLSV